VRFGHGKISPPLWKNPIAPLNPIGRTWGISVRTLNPEKGGECFTFTGTQQNFRLKSN
jgi:hypothetical protein